jgi:RimJ/RimL family protein N-acetyltransferase
MNQVHDLQINQKNYKYILLPTIYLFNFLTNFNLKKSMEEIIKEHKNYYDLQKIINDSKNNKNNNRQTILFILFNIYHNEICHIERLTYVNKSISCYLDFIHTKASYQRQGIGYLALFYLIQHTKSKFKFKYYELKVRKENTQAIHLYSKHKFKIIQEIKQENTETNKMIDVLIMVKKIEK